MAGAPHTGLLWGRVLIDFTMQETIGNLIAEIRGRIELLESSLPNRIDAMVSPDSKLPFKALLSRAALIWRMAELSRGALENFERDKLALAILEARGAVETCAALWYLHAKLDATQVALDWFKTIIGAQPSSGPNLGPVMGPDFSAMTGNLARNLRENRLGVLSAVLTRS